MSDISRKEEMDIMVTGRPICARLHHETWLHKDDSWSQISKFPWYGRNGELKGIVGISSDVTKLVKTEIRPQSGPHPGGTQQNSGKGNEFVWGNQFALLHGPSLPIRNTADPPCEFFWLSLLRLQENWFDALSVRAIPALAPLSVVMASRRPRLHLMEQLSHRIIRQLSLLPSLSLKILNTTMFASAVT